MRVARMRVVGPNTVPKMPYHLRDAECEQGAEAGGDDAVTAVARGVLAACEEERREQHDEHDLTVDREEVQHVRDGVVATGEVVQRVVESEIPADARTLAAG